MRSLAEFSTRIAWMGAAIWLSLALPPARAEPLSIVVRVGEAADHGLFERVRGQASDLAVELAPLDAGPLEATRTAQLERARELGREHGAEVVVWFVRAATTLEVLVADLTAERLFARSIERGEDELARSAQEEAAGLVVRSALRASLLGAALGTPRVELAPKPLPPPEPRVRPEPPLAMPVKVEPRFRAAIAVVGAFDGATDFGQLRVALRCAGVVGPLELGVLGAFGLPSPIEVELAELRTAQHRAGAYLAYVPRLSERVTALIEGGAQLALVRTSARSKRSGFEAEAGRTALAGFDLGLGLRFWVHARVALALSAGATAFSRRIVFGYRDASGFERVVRALPVEPRAMLEVVAAF